MEAGLNEVRSEIRSEPAGEADHAEPHFIYMDPDLGSVAKHMPGVWQREDTLVGIMHATRVTPSATTILCYRPDTTLRQLAETVHTLRLSLGRHAHIVIQEKGASLRYQNEALLLRLGVNLVVHKDVPTSRLPLLLESLRGQVFNRDVNINFEDALASVTPTRLRGYLLPLRFAREVEIILERAETLSVPCVMIVGRPLANLTMMDILMHINLSRSGDLFTADNESCYLFLNACPQSVQLATLERLLGRSVDESFGDLRFVVQRAEIDSELTALSRAADLGQLPDYSSLSETVPAAEPVVAVRGVEKATQVQTPATGSIGTQAPTQHISDADPGESKIRSVPDQPVFAAAAKPPAVTQVEPAFAPLPVFGKKAAPRATRSVPPAGFSNPP
jgi:cellulose biosynthesis protein BcsE